MFDSHANMVTQINTICKNTHFHLRNISSVRSCLTESATAQLVHALVTSRLDYCNSLLYGVPECKTKKLQRIQNIAARIVCRAPRQAHVTPLLAQLHWLPVKMRIIFKILLLTYRCLNNLAPSYLTELVVPYVPARSLRSADMALLEVPKFRFKTYGDRSFQAAAAHEWNNLPLFIRQSTSLTTFKSNLKTHLYNLYFKD